MARAFPWLRDTVFEFTIGYRAADSFRVDIASAGALLSLTICVAFDNFRFVFIPQKIFCQHFRLLEIRFV